MLLKMMKIVHTTQALQLPGDTINDHLQVVTSIPLLYRPPQPPKPLLITPAQRPPELKPSTSLPIPVLNTRNPSDQDAHTYTHTIRSRAICRSSHSTNHTRSHRKEPSLCPVETDGPEQERTS